MHLVYITVYKQHHWDKHLAPLKHSSRSWHTQKVGFRYILAPVAITNLSACLSHSCSSSIRFKIQIFGFIVQYNVQWSFTFLVTKKNRGYGGLRGSPQTRSSNWGTLTLQSTVGISRNTPSKLGNTMRQDRGYNKSGVVENGDFRFFRSLYLPNLHI